MKRFIVTAALISFFIGLMIVYLLTSKGRGYEEPESAWDGPKVVHGILNQEECDYIIKTADASFARSSVIGDDGPNETRTSETAWISKSDPVARKVIEHACKLAGKPYENSEDLQVVRYLPGTYYRAHHDACCEESESCSIFANRGGQRMGTLLVYLNDEFTDGETHFPDYGDIKIKAPKGSAIFFEPLGSSDKCHPKALHAGLPISSGTKYVCNAWVRESAF
jgi:prolyl 4-hydroxylase